jgi:DNA-directed RNA polymerase specialized sigma24 family protein
MTPRVRVGQVRAQRQLERDYEALKASTLRSVASKLRSGAISVPEADLEDYYNQAWHALYGQLSEGGRIDNRAGFLVTVAYRRALDDLRRPVPVPVELGAIAGRGVDDDTVERLDDRRRLREFVEALRDELDERERMAAGLCYLHGYTRPQAAEAMGLSEGRMKKVMDEVSRNVGRFTREIEAGTRCEHRQSSNKAYAIGLLDPDGPRYRSVRAHLSDCAACRAEVLRMRGLAVVAPPVLLPWGAALAAGALGGGAKGGARHGRRSTQAAAATGVAVVIAAVIAALIALRGGDPAQDPVAAAATPAAVTGPATPAKAPETKAKAAPPKQHRAAKEQRAATPPTKTTTVAAGEPATTTPSAPAPAPAPTSPAPTPTPAPVATPTPTATAPPPVDASQEFGVEP